MKYMACHGLKRVLLLLLLAQLSACSLFHHDRSEVREIKLIAEEDANQGMATMVDIVFLYQNDLADLLPKSADEWFPNRFRWRHGNPGQIDIVSLEVPPGRAIDPVTLPKHYKKSVKVVIYTSHIMPEGRMALDISKSRKTLVRVEANKVTIARGNEG